MCRVRCCSLDQRGEGKKQYQDLNGANSKSKAPDTHQVPQRRQRQRIPPRTHQGLLLTSFKRREQRLIQLDHVSQNNEGEERTGQSLPCSLPNERRSNEQAQETKMEKWQKIVDEKNGKKNDEKKFSLDLWRVWQGN